MRAVFGPECSFEPSMSLSPVLFMFITWRLLRLQSWTKRKHWDSGCRPTSWSWCAPWEGAARKIMRSWQKVPSSKGVPSWQEVPWLQEVPSWQPEQLGQGGLELFRALSSLFHLPVRRPGQTSYLSNFCPIHTFDANMPDTFSEMYTSGGLSVHIF